VNLSQQAMQDGSIDREISRMSESQAIAWPYPPPLPPQLGYINNRIFERRDTVLCGGAAPPQESASLNHKAIIFLYAPTTPPRWYFYMGLAGHSIRLVWVEWSNGCSWRANGRHPRPQARKRRQAYGQRTHLQRRPARRLLQRLQVRPACRCRPASTRQPPRPPTHMPAGPTTTCLCRRLPPAK
jgi:hypothetical protein